MNGGPKTNGTLTNGDAHSPKEQSRSKDPSSYAAKFNLKPHFIGGNHLGAAPAGSVKDFVASHDGHTVITSVRLPDPASKWHCAGLTIYVGAHCEQRYRCSQRDTIRTEMGLRNLFRRAGHTIYGHGHTRRFGSKCRLHKDGRSIR